MSTTSATPELTVRATLLKLQQALIDDIGAAHTQFISKHQLQFSYGQTFMQRKLFEVEYYPMQRVYALKSWCDRKHELQLRRSAPDYDRLLAAVKANTCKTYIATYYELETLLP